MRVLISQNNFTVGDIQGNVQKILNSCSEAREKGADLVLTPELAICGYPPEDLLLLPEFIDSIEKALKNLIRGSEGLSLVVGTVRRDRVGTHSVLRNSAAICSNGALLGYYDKQLLPTYDVFDEQRYFRPGRQMPIWNLGMKRVGVTICEDIWAHGGQLGDGLYENDPVRQLEEVHPDLILNLSSSPFCLQRKRMRAQVGSAAARTLRAPLVLCNQVGGNDGLIFAGRSFVVDEKGQLCASSKEFEEDHQIVDIDQLYPQKETPSEPMEELRQALVLGLRDYFQKSGFKKACLGLSGGIDSAVVACVAVDALGAENVLGLCMPSRFSSKGSIEDSHELGKKLGIKVENYSIEGPFQAYLDLLEKPFSGTEFGVTEENLQARVRGMILMAFSNKFGRIVLSTGNKSEHATGYATLYGDMCGGVSVLADVLKKHVYGLARWYNRMKEVIPQAILDKPPSAELAPDQKDSDSLPDYDVVDAVLELYVEEHKSPENIARSTGVALETIQDLVRRIHRNEYKRRQGPLGLRVSPKAFTIGRRFPIVQKWVD